MSLWLLLLVVAVLSVVIESKVDWKDDVILSLSLSLEGFRIWNLLWTGFQDVKKLKVICFFVPNGYVHASTRVGAVMFLYPVQTKDSFSPDLATVRTSCQTCISKKWWIDLTTGNRNGMIDRIPILASPPAALVGIVLCSLIFQSHWKEGVYERWIHMFSEMSFGHVSNTVVLAN